MQEKLEGLLKEKVKNVKEMTRIVREIIEIKSERAEERRKEVMTKVEKARNQNQEGKELIEDVIIRK